MNSNPDAENDVAAAVEKSEAVHRDESQGDGAMDSLQEAILQAALEDALMTISFSNDKASAAVNVIKVTVPEVPGCYLLEGFLSPAEAQHLKHAVESYHAFGSPKTAVTTQTGTEDQDPLSPRRRSQHHVPCRVKPHSLQNVCNRLREYLPQTAGPSCNATVAPNESSLSPFLRMYSYKTGDCSPPHYDRPQSFHEASKGPNLKGGRLVQFSAYSILFYLNGTKDQDDDECAFSGGETTFFKNDSNIKISRRGLTPNVDSLKLLEVVARIRPGKGDVLIFPHGNHPGCYPNPLHEGSIVKNGSKIIIRTDIMFVPQSKTSSKKKKKKNVTSKIRESTKEISDIEALLIQAVNEVCPRFANLVQGSVKLDASTNHKAPEYNCNIASQIFWAAKKHQDVSSSLGASQDLEMVDLTSDYGVARAYSRQTLAEAILRALPSLHKSILAYTAVVPGPAASIAFTSRTCSLVRSEMGLVPCPVCGRWVSAAKSGLEWHTKTVHGVIDHAIAHQVAATALNALVPVMQSTSANDLIISKKVGVLGPVPDDLTAAQRDPQISKTMVASGRVKKLSPGLEACRCGDFDELVALCSGQRGALRWRPENEVDKHGSGALHWAAGGGHLRCCKYLVEECNIQPQEPQSSRRGYDGRSALHWAARNGHINVVKWLVNDCKCDINSKAADGTTPFHLAAWQASAEVCHTLVSLGASPHTLNSYGCNAAMWTAQGSIDTIEKFRLLHEHRVHFDLINNNGQGCLHKAAQRGNMDACVWLLDIARIQAKEHFMPNAMEKSVPSDLAKYSGAMQLSKVLKGYEAQQQELTKED